ncbi:hypothetical protein [Natronospira bacteriovora]|uniref:Cobalt transport protein n=1 Tax=Natronospira bacteriovora TaxID=3069753 RepID=A0ABU0W4H6_9GAMM|nr:hypothetical protein [Natronospira sp. AB-CW4]MDQ2068922.1 hypothetical protein [Natronospira sp. AB-CW4]
MLNPRLHLLLVVLLACALPWMSPLSLLILAAVLLVWHVSRGRAAMRGLGRGLWRLKWLLLALALVYFWLAGMADWANAIAEAGTRMAILVLMFASVHTLLVSLSASALTGLLMLALQPLDRIGLPGRRFGQRLGWLVQAAMADRQALRDRAGGPSTSAGHFRFRAWLAWIPAALAAEIHRIEARAEEEDGKVVLPRPPPAPQVRDWLLFLAGMTGILLLAGLPL